MMLRSDKTAAAMQRLAIECRFALIDDQQAGALKQARRVGKGRTQIVRQRIGGTIKPKRAASRIDVVKISRMIGQEHRRRIVGYTRQDGLPPPPSAEPRRQPNEHHARQNSYQGSGNGSQDQT